VTILPNTHVSPETAYVVADYPYGFKLRCQMRYWLEYKAKHGVRVVMQSSNPKKPGVWNKPKPGIYHRFGAALYLDDLGHVQCAGLSEYSGVEEAKHFLSAYGEAVPVQILPQLKFYVRTKEIYEEIKEQHPELHYLTIGKMAALRAVKELK
jgi:hypothetical protein